MIKVQQQRVQMQNTARDRKLAQEMFIYQKCLRQNSPEKMDSVEVHFLIMCYKNPHDNK